MILGADSARQAQESLRIELSGVACGNHGLTYSHPRRGANCEDAREILNFYNIATIEGKHRFLTIEEARDVQKKL